MTSPMSAMDRLTLPLALSFTLVILAAATSGAQTTNGPTGAELGATSTIDSLAVNLDELSAATTAAAFESPESSGTTSPEEGAEPAGEGLGIEGRSGSAGSGGLNSLADKQEQPSKGEPTPADKTRPPSRLNMSQVDQLFMEGYRDERVVADSWSSMQRRLKKSVGSIIGSIVPMALNMSQEAKISSECSGAVLKWVLSMNQLKSWALKMLDASGKPISGLLEGSLTMFGNYRQCLRVRAPDDDEIEFSGKFEEYFRGKYCVLQAKPWLPEKSPFYNLNTKIGALMDGVDKDTARYDQSVFDELSEWVMAFNFVSIRMDLCVPSLCSREDLQKAVNFLTKGIDLKVRILRCEMDSRDAAGQLSVEDAKQWTLDHSLASESDDELAATAASMDQKSSLRHLGLWFAVPVAAVGLVLVASAATKALGDGRLRTSHKGLSKLTHAIKSLSIQRSIGSHLDVDYDQLADDKPLALYGIRFMLVVWVILVESAVNLKFEYLRELLMLKDLIFWWPLQVIINSTLQFDSIILLTAFTMSYKNCLNDGASNVRSLTRFVLDKYIRLMPSIMVLVALVIMLPLAYRGPVWNDYVMRQSDVCQSTGWLNVVFLQNYLPYEQICLPQTWILCIELQLVLLMAPIVYYLNKSYVKRLDRQAELSFAPGKEARQQLRQLVRTQRPFYWMFTTPGVVLILCALAGLLASFLNVYTKKLPPSWFYTMPDPDGKSVYFGEHMLRLWTHLAVFAVGLVAGLECRRAARNVTQGYRARNLGLVVGRAPNGKGTKSSDFSSSASLPVLSRSDSMSSRSTGNGLMGSSVTIDLGGDYTKAAHSPPSDELGACQLAREGALTSMMRLAGCLVAVATMMALIFSPHSWSVGELPSPLVAGLFDVFSRSLWSVALVWLLYMVTVPNEDNSLSRLAKTLGHPMMVFLGKLSFLIYILYPVVHTIVLAIQEQPIYSSWLMLFHILIGNLTITVMLASILSLFVEIPCRNLFRRCGRSMFLAHSMGTLENGSSDTSMKHQNEN